MNLKVQKARGRVYFTEDQMRQLLSYHGKCTSYEEIAAEMNIKPVSRVKNKCKSMGVNLRKAK